MACEKGLVANKMIFKGSVSQSIPP